MLFVLVFTSCSSNSGGTSSVQNDNNALYKAAIERYFNAYIKADLDTLLDSLDPEGLLYPEPETIQNLRDTAESSAVEGEAVVKDITVLEESSVKAKVKATVYMRIDMSGSGDFQEDTSDVTFDLSFKDGTWRLYNATNE
jgi:hypothetical protein